MTDTTLDTTIVLPSEEVVSGAKPDVNTDGAIHHGKRGEVGPHNIKGLFHSFLRQGRKNNGITLKDFARKVLAENVIPEEVELVEQWLDRKQGKDKKDDRARRQKNKGATLAAIRLASKNARRGKK